MRARLRDAVMRPFVREAIFVASPSLDERIQTWLDAPESESGRKVEGALVRYFARMTGRATPFGLFAGCSLGVVDGTLESTLEIDGRASYGRHTRVDMDFLTALAEALDRDPDVRRSLSFCPSSSLYRAAGRLRFVESRLGGKDHDVRTYHLATVEPTDAICATLERAKDGAKPGDLAAALVADDAEIARDEADAFVIELIESQLLVSDLAPRVTGEEPIHGMISALGGMPHGRTAAAAFAGARDAALAAGDFRVFVDGISSPSGANLLSRFCHADPKLHAAVSGLVRAEESRRPDVIHAEVVHLPEGRIGNVLLRPLLREYEIAFLGRSGAPAEKQIALDDLRVSIDGRRIVLRSARLGREIVPRLTTAHDFDVRALGAYRFLGRLQQQDAPGFAWSWGPLDRASFLPRVVSGRAVLSRARWHLLEKELRPFEKLRGNEAFRAVQSLRETFALPRFIVCAEGDKLLPIDLDNVLSVEVFAHLARGKTTLTLEEMFPEPGELVTRGPEGRFVHELVVPFVRAGEPAKAAAAPAPIRAARSPRVFSPGSSWLYAQLHCGAATADQVLTAVVAPIVARTRASGAVDRWFFIRYADPSWHLRLRFHGSPDRLLREVLPELHEATRGLFLDGRVWKLSLDTYDPEIERYGGDLGLALSERVFEADSDAALAIVAALEGEEGGEARWRLALCSIHALLSDFGLEATARREMTRKLRDAYAREHRADARFEHQLGQRYRRDRGDLAAMLGGAADHPLSFGLSILAERSRKVSPIAAEIRAAEARGALSCSVDELLTSHLHMIANRLLRSAARAQELVLYDLLYRMYDSEIARGRSKRV